MNNQVAKIRVAALTLAVVLGAIPPAALSADTPSKAPVENYQQVSRTLCRGAQPSSEDLKKLADRGVKTIIDLRMEGSGTRNESECAKELGLNYFHLPMGYWAPPLSTIITFLDVVTNPKYQPVFVHCRQGADRTGTLVGIYRVLVQGWSFEDTYQEMRRFHFKPFLFGMKHAVAAFSRYIPSHGKDSILPLLSIENSVEAAAEAEGRERLAARRDVPGS